MSIAKVETLIKSDPFNPAQHLALAKVYLEEGDEERARKVWFFFEEFIPVELAKRLLDALLDRVPAPGVDLSVRPLLGHRAAGVGSEDDPIPLPLGIHPNTGKRSAFVDHEGDPFEDQLLFLKKMNRIESFEDLVVYQKLCDLHLELHQASLKFPPFELYELGSQLRRSSNSAPANIAEGWNNKHTNIYLEGINRSMGELQEALHHLRMAYRKGYFSEKEYESYRYRYLEAARMLRGLERSVEASKANTGDKK